MDRKLASIQRIKSIKPIKGADKIEVAEVLGWKTVIPKDYGLKPNDLVVFIEVDSFLPLIPQFDFLAKGGTKKILVEGKEVEGIRLRTVRLRGQISQGLCLPIGSFPDKLNVQDIWEEGIDVTEKLGILKYEPQMPAQLAGVARGGFPGFIPRTDETRIQAYPDILEKYKDEIFYVTEKLDGSSTTFFIKNGEFHVCSRSLDLLETEGNTIWRVAREMKLEEKLSKVQGYALQGEIVGEKIQNNKLKINGQKIYFFNIYDFEESKYLDYKDFIEVCKTLELPTVPIVNDKYELPKTVDEIVAFATKKSVINPDIWVEGYVFRPRVEMQDEDLGRLSFKVINPEFLLEYGE